jgi:hypothetical protein
MKVHAADVSNIRAVDLLEFHLAVPTPVCLIGIFSQRSTAPD